MSVIVVEITSYNEEKRADRLLNDEMVVYMGRIGRVRAAEFSDDGADVMVTFDVTHKSGTKSPVVHIDTVTLTVSRTTIFNTVQTMAVK